MTKRSLPPNASVASSDGSARMHAPAAARNAEAITALLADIAPASGTALELASGTGQHVVQFAKALPGVVWQPSDVDDARLASIETYRAEAGLETLRPALLLDATAPGWGAEHGADLIVVINLLHLISTPEARTLISEAARALSPEGCFVIYGPFMRGGDLTSDGDRAFHASLTASDPEIGYKDDFDTLDWLQEAGLEIAEVIEMPANNLAIVAHAV